MPPSSKKARPHGKGKLGADGLTDRERAFAQERRKDPTVPNHVIAKRAGFEGNAQKLSERARLLMQKPAVCTIIYAPAPIEPLDDGKVGEELKRFFLTVVRSNASPADKIRAADKLGATLQGFYVPVQVDMKGKMTMEAIVRAMGGAPEESKPQGLLPGHDNEPDKGADA